MDKDYNIYELSEQERELLKEEVFDSKQAIELREDVARLEGYLKGRSEIGSMARGEGPGKARGKGSNKDLAG